MKKEVEAFIKAKHALGCALRMLHAQTNDRRAACALWDAVATLLVECREAGVIDDHLTALHKFLGDEWPTATVEEAGACSEAPIYLISVVSDDLTRRRVWGFFHERGNALECVANNETDICERGYYYYGVVSKMTVGPLAVAEDEVWFRFVNDDEWRGVQIDKPADWRQMMFGF